MEQQNTSDTCFFTIVSRNYLHFAKTLMKSLQLYGRSADRYVCLCDRKGRMDFSHENFNIIEIEELNIPEIEKFIFQYTILELNTAIKPFVFEKLFREKGFSKVIYFDPDIRVYRDLHDMISLLDNNSILLTPHLTGRLDDGKHPGELEILQSGTYNLGYLGLSNTPESNELLEWWQSKMMRECIVDIPRGLFVDQKWMDMVPGMFKNVFIQRDPGWNVAYWNLNHRTVTKNSDEYKVNGSPLTFFHYSGISPDGRVFSKHQDRFSLKNLPAAVQELAHGYVEALTANGAAELAKKRYSFECFPGTSIKIPDLARKIYREERDAFDKKNIKINSEADTKKFLGILNSPALIAGRSSRYITRFMYALYEVRPDLQYAFPDIFGVNAMDYAKWFISNAKEQTGIDNIFINPVIEALNKKEGTADSQEAPPHGTIHEDNVIQIPLSSGLPQNLWKKIYKMAWNFKPYIRKLVRQDMRHRAHAWLTRKAFETHPPAGQPDHAETATTAIPGQTAKTRWGFNLIGYIHAESGVGESARANIRAAVANGIPVAPMDFRQGNISRMNEQVPVKPVDSPQYPVNLFHINADQMNIARQELGESIFGERYNIGYWAWELPEFPEEWRDSFQYLNEIWVPSSFCQKAISKSSPVPVITIPHCISAEAPPYSMRGKLGIPEDGFIFLTMFDMLSIPERKNPIGILKAFEEAFGHTHKGIYLLIKVINSDHNSKMASEIKKFLTSDNAIIMVDSYLDRNELNALIGSCDCYISMHRSEGFGLCLAEAMYMGKPVIATAWSGNMDFMTPWNSFLVDYALVEIEKDYGPYRKGQIWADPDIQSASRQMQAVVAEPARAGRVGDRARKDILENFSPAATGLSIKNRLKKIQSFHTFS